MKQILIFDAGGRHLKQISTHLKKHYSVYGFRAIEDVRVHLENSTPDIAILCMSQDLKQKHLKIFKDLSPVIGVVGKEMPGTVKKALSAGITDFLIAPCRPFELKLSIDSALRSKTRIEKLQKEKERLQAINETTFLVSSTLDLQEMLYTIVRKIAEIVPVVRCSMIRIDREENTADVVATSENPKIKNIKLDLDKYPEIKEAILTKHAIVVNDIKTDPIMMDVRDIISPLGIKSIIVLPIFYRDTAIGTLFLRTSRSRRSFTLDEIRFCSTVTNACANAIYNAFLYERLEYEKTSLGKLAITDFLTGLYNVRYFYHRIEEEFTRAQRYKFPLTCLMIDIDFFKRINDTYSHRVGDQVLKEFAQVLKKNVRSGDLLARYGGEEFIILLPNTAKIGSITASEKLRLCIKDHKFKSLRGKEAITVSIGIASFPHERINTSDDLITCADTALLEAKTKGRNQVIFFT